MRVLFSPNGTLYDDGVNQYYGTDVYTQIQRYRILGDKITVFLKYIKTDKPIGVLRNPNDGVDILFIKKINSIKSKLLYEKDNLRIVEKAVKKSDLCICHVPATVSYPTIKYAKKYRKPFLNVVVACPFDSLWNYDWRGKLMAPFAYLKLRSVQASAPYSIYVTQQFLQHRYPTKGVQIGASDVDFLPPEEITISRRHNRILSMSDDNRNFSLCTLAALVPYKGHRYVIKALPKLKELGFFFTYHIIGSGDQTNLRILAERLGVDDMVVFHGMVHHDKVFSILDDIDIYIQPSKQEGLPRSMVEAMSRGCVPVGSNIAGIPELVSPDCLFPKGNVNGIVKILASMTKERLMNLSLRSFNLAKEYDSQKLQKKYRDFLMDFKDKVINQK